jgi:hypothetical protein
MNPNKLIISVAKVIFSASLFLLLSVVKCEEQADWRRLPEPYLYFWSPSRSVKENDFRVTSFSVKCRFSHTAFDPDLTNATHQGTYQYPSTSGYKLALMRLGVTSNLSREFQPGPSTTNPARTIPVSEGKARTMKCSSGLTPSTANVHYRIEYADDVRLFFSSGLLDLRWLMLLRRVARSAEPLVSICVKPVSLLS